MSEFDRLWKQQNNPACSKSVTVFIMLKLDTIQKTKKKKELGQIETQRQTDRDIHRERGSDRQTDTETERIRDRQTETWRGGGGG